MGGKAHLGGGQDVRHGLCLLKLRQSALCCGSCRALYRCLSEAALVLRLQNKVEVFCFIGTQSVNNL